MSLPHRIATLLYCFHEDGRVLLMERRQEPNLGLFSPPGGKLRADEGESPYACACREAREEMELDLVPADCRLAGMVSEHGYEGQAHWLMFLFEIEKPLVELPTEHAEGVFQFVARGDLYELPLPQTDNRNVSRRLCRRVHALCLGSDRRPVHKSAALHGRPGDAQ